MFCSSHDSIIKEKLHQTIQITAFKESLAQRIIIKGCEDYKRSGFKH